MPNRYTWQQQYEAAILEVNSARLMERMIAAQSAVNARIREMQASHDGSLEEKRALMNAISGLQRLRNVTLQD